MRLGPVAENQKHPVLQETEKQLAEYFEGKRKSFSVRLDAQGTDFQNKVWQALRTIPFGETRSYGQIARQIGNAKEVARGRLAPPTEKNPISIIVPCHRVIGARPVNFTQVSCGGLDIKERLLLLEDNPGVKKSRTKMVRTP